MSKDKTPDGFISYDIRFQPGNYYVKEQVPVTIPGSNAPHYWAILRADTHSPVGFSFEENAAKTMCLAMELLSAQIIGDTTRQLEIMRTVERLMQ